ncbi:hypothetical protein ABAZ39_28455 (plasmid) [Azospirillum argentinense]|uniref:Transcriptional coactivator p15/PC4 family protein n=1 Tax=Azospirillum argentinense TaxID=2970906 RepID=A0A060DY91_9PROT|nr:transcriptional coactivator p15/PC4 family protein [Azospirillum argentinense]AIB15794.1 hypothetical protein ABAZ39_28455 [Azospirillum argentinense]EZQ03295.1 hypothetical protein ABAZ39_27310 [Azospirillum argentinense]
MSNSDTDTIVATIPKNATEELRVTLTSYNGHPLVDLRLFTEYRSTGEIGPTRKGLTVSVALLPQIIAGLQDAEAEARQRGLL